MRKPRPVAQRDGAEEGRHRNRPRDRDERRGAVAKSVPACQQRREVGGNTKVGGVSERGHPAETDQEIEAECKYRRDQDLACEIDVEIAREQRQREK